MKHLLIFAIDESLYAMDLYAVEKVVRAASVTPMIDGPAAIEGLINIRGEILPVINTRHCLRLPRKDLSPEHQFIIASTASRKVVLWVDSVYEIRSLSDSEIVDMSEIVHNGEKLEGAVICYDGMILICNMENILKDINDLKSLKLQDIQKSDRHINPEPVPE